VDVEVKKEMMMKLISWLQNTEMFVQEQAPLLAQEMLTFGFWWSVIQSVLFSICIAGAIWWTRKFYFTEWGIDFRKRHKTKDFVDIIYFLTWIYNVICIPLTCGLLSSIYTIIKITLAPRLYLLDKLMNILS